MAINIKNSFLDLNALQRFFIMLLPSSVDLFFCFNFIRFMYHKDTELFMYSLVSLISGIFRLLAVLSWCIVLC